MCFTINRLFSRHSMRDDNQFYFHATKLYHKFIRLFPTELDFSRIRRAIERGYFCVARLMWARILVGVGGLCCGQYRLRGTSL